MYRPYSSSLADSRPFMDVQSLIRDLNQDYVTSFNTGNYDQVAALFALDGVLMISHRESSQGVKAIERMLRQYGDAGYQNLRFETTRVDYSGDMGIEMGRYSVSVEMGNTHVSDAGKFLRAWRRLGAWRIIGDSWTSSVPVGSHELKLENDAKVA